MTVELKSGVRYRMPTVFGPAPGPRQKPDGTPWTLEESGTMHARWMTVAYRVPREKLEAVLPPGFAIRGEPALHVSLAQFDNLYWLAGRGYGILNVEVPVTYTGKTEKIDGAFCPVIWEGRPDAILTGREELGFPKMFADIPELTIDLDNGKAGGEASWMDFKFFDISLAGLEEVKGDMKLTGPGGAALFYKYMPRTGPFGSGGCDVSYVTSSQPLPGTSNDASPIKLSESSFRKWKGTQGSVTWNRATFEQLPTAFHVVNGVANLDVGEVLSVEMIEFSAPGIAVSANVMRPVEPA